MLSYLLEVHICWLLFYALYAASLSKEKYFHTNRWYLMATFILSLFLPLLQLSQFSSAALGVIPEVYLPVYILLGQDTGVHATGSNWGSWVQAGYWVGVAVFGLRYLISLAGIGMLYVKGNKSARNGYILVQGETVRTPFSYFNMLFLPPASNIAAEEHKMITRHEEAHIRGLHSLDLTLVEFIRIFLWFSPVVSLYRRSIQNTHEFLADAAVLRHCDAVQYGRLLINFVPGTMSRQPVLANHFFQSQLKKRIVMMARHSSNQLSLLKYLLVIPLIMMMFFVLSCKEAIDEAMQPPASATPRADTSEVEPFRRVEKMPEFPGGTDSMLHFMQRTLVYPESEKTAGIEGTVVLEFVVGKDGGVRDPRIMRSIGPAFDEEVLRMVTLMPDWAPGVQDGQRTEIKMTLPVRFKL